MSNIPLTKKKKLISVVKLIKENPNKMFLIVDTACWVSTNKNYQCKTQTYSKEIFLNKTQTYKSKGLKLPIQDWIKIFKK